MFAMYFLMLKVSFSEWMGVREPRGCLCVFSWAQMYEQACVKHWQPAEGTFTHHMALLQGFSLQDRT